MNGREPRAARQFPARDDGKPVAGFDQGTGRLAAMGVDVHSGKIRDELLVAILLDVKDQKTLLSLRLATVAPAPEEDPQFQRHVEAGQAVRRIELGAGKVVNPVTAFLDDVVQLFEPHLSPVV